MPPSPQGSSGQPAIASFAPELIDEILHHLVLDLQWPTSSTEYPGPKDIAPLSLISQNWRGPVQRRLMSRLVIKSGTQAKQVAEGFVESDHFVALLPHFPALTSLHLDGPPFTRFLSSEIAQLRASPIFPRLTTLRICTRRWHRDTDLAHAILSLTPSLTTLAMKSDRKDTLTSPNTKTAITLPHLESLELEGRTASSFLDLGVLSLDTIARVSNLFWYDDSPRSSAQSLLRLVGSSLKTLRYLAFFAGNRDIAAELQSCTILERLDLDLFNGVPEGLFEHLPPTIHTLTLSDLRSAHQLVVNNFAARSPSLKTFKLKLDTDDQDEKDGSAEAEKERLKEIVNTLKDTGVELVVTGDSILNQLEDIH